MPSRSKHFEDAFDASGKSVTAPHTTATGQLLLNDRRRRTSIIIVVCGSVSNYGLARLDRGCNDFNPFAGATDAAEYL